MDYERSNVNAVVSMLLQGGTITIPCQSPDFMFTNALGMV